MDGEAHADRGPAAGARLDLEAFGQLSPPVEGPRRSRGCRAAASCAAFVADVDLETIVGIAPGEHLDIARSGRSPTYACTTALVTASETATAIPSGSIAPCSRA